MRTHEQITAVLELLESRSTVDAVAGKYGVTPQELEGWRALYLAGLKDAQGAQGAQARFGRGRRLGVGLAVLAAVVATAASAQLVTFTAGSPALAVDVNNNFALLKTWLEQKVGTAGQASVRIASTEAMSLAAVSGGLVIGTATAANLGFDTNELQARTGVTPSTMWINGYGGDLVLGSAGYTITPAAKLGRTGASGVLNLPGPLPQSDNFVTTGGRVLLMVSGSGYGAAAANMVIDVNVDGTNVTTLETTTNEAASHKAFPTRFLMMALPAGTHTVRLAARSGTTTDLNDRFSVGVIELPL